MKCEHKVKKEFLAKGTSIMSLVHPENPVPDDIFSFVRQDIKIRQNRKGVFFEVILEDDLHLLLEEAKKSELDDCPCRIPVLDNSVADSVNKAH